MKHWPAIALCVLASLFVTPAAHAAFMFEASSESALAETIDMQHMPNWVQAALSSVVLFNTDSGKQEVARVSRYTYMQVLGGAERRLLVEALNDGGQVAARGWVDPDDVLPSASGRDWLVTSTQATLFKTPDNAAPASRTLDQFTPLQLLDGPVQGRIEVRVFSSDLQKVVEQGWIDQAQTGPALPPQARVPDPVQKLSFRKASSEDQWAFLDSAAGAAIVASGRTGVPASVTVAQAILESDWGRSQLSQSARNYFGIKALGGLGNDGVVWMSTGEFDSEGQAYTTTSPFRAYRSLTDSLIDHDLMLSKSQRYASAMQAAHDPRQFAQALADAGYATDPEYATKLIALMDRYDLYRLDG
jgi:flagellum-specific peptidoglycan hydrolase FlgJ